MKGFDDEIEKAVNRAGKASGWMFALGVITLVLGVGSIGSESGVFLLTLPGAGLLFGMGVVINLLGMHLMETWRQGRQSDGHRPETTAER